jgi:tRNA threonylcarbamoyladenosine biosynthesis protein TsaB
MWVLALDTSAPDGSVAVLRDDTVIVEQRGSADRSHAERLPQALHAALAIAGIGPGALDLLGVATGPGAFTGLRVGLATVQGLALALDRPVAGVSTLAATAWQQLDGAADWSAVGVWLDAARGDVFAAAYARPANRPDGWPLQTLAAPTVAAPDATLALWRDTAAAGVPLVLGAGARGADVARTAGQDVHDARAPLAATLGRLALRAHRAGRSGPPHALAPEYVRRPDAEVERDRRRGPATPAP